LTSPKPFVPRSYIAAASDLKDIQRRKIKFKEQSLKIFARYKEHLDNVYHKDKAAALQMIKKDFNIGYGEAKIFITEGRRLEREKKRVACKSLSSNQKTISQDHRI
jgi:hypothetical protein